MADPETWEQLSPAARATLLFQLIERIDYDGVQGKVTITFRSGTVAEDQP